ncbi:histidine kinase [Hymenobacter sp. YC55]|uniref:sensor histidine kinase n=1 Tax=Hymenobacter sp. YC55 TaxID=3034019 RepID=UPI0023F7FD57|nr:histidine kinase [Hymenobacter sp. YC55]MDF7814104.1 histidine kinase [Hymenobacter sp. YC55]
MNASTQPLATSRVADSASPWLAQEPRLRWLGIGTMSLLLTVTMRKADTLAFWQDLLSHFVVTALYWQGNVAIFIFLRRRLPGYKLTVRRVVLHVLLGSGFVMVATLFNAWLEVRFEEPGAAFVPTYWRNLRFSLLTTLLITNVYESVYFFQEWRNYFMRAAALERENAISRLEALKQQVDPHFLFNSLNTMAALIGENEPAQEFLGALANVYRYILLSKKSTTVSLSEEMTFVEAYVYLNAIRFGKKIQVVKDIDPAALQLRVPPVAVQMLIENAIKHNAINSRFPLRITIRATEQALSVTNTMHPKTVLEKSTRQGLQNIVSRFQLLTDRPVLIDNRGSEFEVVLPLLTHPE